MAKAADVITAVEIGTASIKVFMGIPETGGSMTIAGLHEVPSAGRVVKGEVINAAAVTELLGDALNAVEKIAGRRIDAVFLAVTGRHIGSVNVLGKVPVTGPGHVITENELIEATRHAREHNLPMDKYKVQSFQRSYIVDGKRRTSQPLGMVGNNLTADIHVIYGDYNIIETQCKLLEGALGFPASDIAFSGIADFYGLAGAADTQNGLLAIDIGAGVTEYVVFRDHGCVHSGQLAVGCEHIANDLAIGLQLPMPKARELLRDHGVAVRRDDGMLRQVQLEVLLRNPPRVFSEGTIATIIELRLRELFEVLRADLHERGTIEQINPPIMLCGGGALIPEITSLCASVFNLPARVAEPTQVAGDEREVNSPRFVTPIGLLHLGHHLMQMERQTTLPFKEQIRRDCIRVGQVLMKAFRI